jgi:hypothetical protein
MPTSLKGSVASQTIGHITRTSSASGQHTTNNKHQTRKAIICISNFKSRANLHRTRRIERVAWAMARTSAFENFHELYELANRCETAL